MTRRRHRRRILGAAALLAALVVLVLLLPPVQTALVRGLVGGVDGVDIALGRVAAGPWGATVEGLQLAAPGIDIEVPRAEVDLGFWSSLGHLSLDVEGMTASGVRVRIGRLPERADRPSEPSEFNGLGPLARVPKRLVVRRADIDGTIELLVADDVVVDGPWAVRASGLGPGGRAEAALDASLGASRGSEPLAAAVVTASVAADLDDSGAVTGLTADAALHPGSDQTRSLRAQVTAGLAEAAETYRFELTGSGGSRLVETTVQLDSRSRRLEADWTAEIAPDQLASFARGRGLPELAARSTGSAVLDLADGRVRIDAEGRFEGRGWAELDPRLAEVGDLVADAAVVGTLAGARLEARRLRLAVSGADGREVLRVSALQPVAVDLDQWRIDPERWGETALRLEADRMPLRWARGFTPGVDVEGGVLSLALDVVPIEPGHASLETHQPIRAASVVLRTNGGVDLPPVDLTVEPRVFLDRGVLEAAVERARLTTPAGLDIRFGGRAATSRERWPAVDLDGELSVSVPRVHRLIEEIDRVSGRVRLELHLDSMVIGAEDADLDVTEADGHSMLAVRFDNEEPLLMALPSLEPDWASATPQRVQVVVDGFPVAWVSQFLPEIDLEGGALFGELRAVTGGGGLRLESVAPFELRGLDPIYRGRRFGQGSTASVEPALALDDEGVRFALENLRVRGPKGDRVDGELVLVAPRVGRGRIDASLVLEGRFPSVTERIGRLGALSWRQRAVVDVPSRTVEVTDLDVGLTDAAGTRFLELNALRPFKVATMPFEVRAEGGPPEILLATVTPLQLQQLFPRVLGFELEGVLPQGQFVGRAEDGGLLLAADDPLVFRDVTVRWGEAAVLDRVTVGLEYQVLYSADGLQARSIDFETLGPRGTPIADATVRAVMPLTDDTTIESLHFEAVANLEPLTRQPVFRGLPAFVEGTAGGSLDLQRGERSTLRGTLALRGATIDGRVPLPDLGVSIDVVTVAGERLEISAPLRLTSGANGSSDLLFEGEAVRIGNGLRVDASLTGERIAAADVVELLRLASPTATDLDLSDLREPAASAFRERWSKAAIEQLRERRDTRPVWGSRVSGRADLRLGTVQLSRYAVHGVEGRLEIDPSRLELVGARASLLGAELELAGALRFESEAERPYALDLESSFEGLDLGRLFRAVDPEAPPTLEGVFEVRSEASGRGRNLADLGLGSLGSVRLSGRHGVFRGLAGQFGLARSGAGVLGFLTFSKQLKAVSRLLGELEALEFDTFTVELARETPQRFAISELTVVSPLAVIDGSGGVEVEAGVPLAAGPLDASFRMATRGDLTILFDGLGLLGDGEDERGYRPLIRPVAVGGTVSEPDTSAFYEMLDEASRDSKGVIGVAMRRINRKLQKGR